MESPQSARSLPLPKDSIFRAARRRSRIRCGQPALGRPYGRASTRAGGGMWPLPRRRRSVHWLRASAAHEHTSASVLNLEIKSLFCMTSPPPRLTRRSISPSPFSHAHPILVQHPELLRNCHGHTIQTPYERAVRRQMAGFYRHLLATKKDHQGRAASTYVPANPRTVDPDGRAPRRA